MLNVRLDESNGIAFVTPQGKLTKTDFIAAAAKIDPYIEQHGNLKGLLIETESFPGWVSFGAMASHLHFVKDHHQEIKRVALVTDSPIGDIAEKLGNHFVSAELKTFDFNAREQAKLWLTNPA